MSCECCTPGTYYCHAPDPCLQNYGVRITLGPAEHTPRRAGGRGGFFGQDKTVTVIDTCMVSSVQLGGAPSAIEKTVVILTYEIGNGGQGLHPFYCQRTGATTANRSGGFKVLFVDLLSGARAESIFQFTSTAFNVPSQVVKIGGANALPPFLNPQAWNSQCTNNLDEQLFNTTPTVEVFPIGSTVAPGLCNTSQFNTPPLFTNALNGPYQAVSGPHRTLAICNEACADPLNPLP